MKVAKCTGCTFDTLHIILNALFIGIENVTFTFLPEFIWSVAQKIILGTPASKSIINIASSLNGVPAFFIRLISHSVSENEATFQQIY